MPGKSLAPRTMAGAVVAARNNGKERAAISLMNGERFHFSIAEVVDDALIGTRTDNVRQAAIIPYHAIAMIEFLP